MTETFGQRAPALEEAARRLRAAYGGEALEPMRDVLDPMDMEGAYAVQSINTAIWESCGRRIVGRKIGLTSKAVQTQLGVGHPDFGVLFDDMRIPDGGELAFPKLIHGRAEAEVALILARDIDEAAVTPGDILAATESAAPAIEIVDSRIEGWRITFADTVADNGSSAFFVLGKNRTPLDGLDLAACEMTLSANGKVVSTGSGEACLGHPLNAAAWLATTLAQRGERLRAGDIVLTGALGPMVDLTVGTAFEARISGLGSVSFRVGDR